MTNRKPHPVRSGTAAPSTSAASIADFSATVALPGDCKIRCYGSRQRYFRDPGGEDITQGRATDDPAALPDDAAILQFTAAGRRASYDDLARITCPSNLATALLACDFKTTCRCLEALRAHADPVGEQIAAFEMQGLVAVPVAHLHPQRVTMPSSIASALNRGSPGKAKRTRNIKSVPADFLYGTVVKGRD